MDAKTFDDAVKTLDALMDQAAENAEAIVITRTGKPAAVLVSLDEWNNIQEMLNLSRSPVNRARLDQAVRDADAGKAIERELVAK